MLHKAKTSLKFDTEKQFSQIQPKEIESSLFSTFETNRLSDFPAIPPSSQSFSNFLTLP
jgi:hypothetical protein